jgi:hypothetical protein
MLLRNGGRKFADITSAAKVNDLGHVVSIIPTISTIGVTSIYSCHYGKAPALFSNRATAFRNASK